MFNKQQLENLVVFLDRVEIKGHYERQEMNKIVDIIIQQINNLTNKDAGITSTKQTEHTKPSEQGSSTEYDSKLRESSQS